MDARFQESSLMLSVCATAVLCVTSMAPERRGRSTQFKKLLLLLLWGRGCARDDKRTSSSTVSCPLGGGTKRVHILRGTRIAGAVVKRAARWRAASATCVIYQGGSDSSESPARAPRGGGGGGESSKSELYARPRECDGSLTSVRADESNQGVFSWGFRFSK